MTKSRRFLIPLGLAAVIGLGGPAVTSADDGHSDGDLLRSEIVGSTPSPDGPTLFGVPPAGAPWVSQPGDIRIGRDGRVDIRVRGLVIPTAPSNGTNPLPQISASVVCNGAIAATTAAVPFDPAGNARIRSKVTLPSSCLAPAVLLHPNSVTTRYIAANG